jgi:polysaccharide biosynthesis transport protein
MQNQEFYKYNEQVDEQEIKLTDYLHIISRYKWLVIFVFIAVFSIAVIYTARAPRIYQATSKVLLEDKANNNLLFTSFSNQGNSINNNIQILKSNPVMEIADQILKKLVTYDQLPVSQLEGSHVGYLKENLAVDTERETDILIISFASTSPLEAKEAANAAAYALMQQDTDYARIEYRNTREFLSDQLEENERELRSSEEDLRSYKIEHGVSMLSEETQELIKQSSELSALLSEAETELEVENKHLSYLRKELSAQDTLLLDVNSILTSPLLDQLKTEIVMNQSQYVNLLTQSGYSPDHPQLKTINSAVENAKKRLNEEIQRIILVRSGSADPLLYRSQLIEKIATSQIEQNLKESKVISLQEAVETYNRQMSLLPDTEIELARLERNNQINVKLYTMLIEKFEEAKIVERSKVGNIRLVEEAVIPGNPIKPSVKMNMMIAIVLGLGLGIGAALLLHSLDSKIRTFDDVRKFVGLPLLGTIPHIHLSEADIDKIDTQLRTAKGETKKNLLIAKHQIEARLITNYSPKSSSAEAFRILRTNIVTKKKPGESLTILITSSGPGEGKSTIHSNLATTLAQMDAKVILVDLDLRRPMIHKLVNLDKEHGISDFLVDKTSNLESFVKRSHIPHLDVITSGFVPPNPSELLASRRMDEALDILKTKYDYILLDSPPVIAVTDTMVMARKSDMLTLVVRVGQADKNVIKRAKELLENINISIAGAIINGIHPQKYYSTYEYNYYYYYYYGKKEDKKRSSKLFSKNKSIS